MAGRPTELHYFERVTWARDYKYNHRDPSKPIRDKHDNALPEKGPELVVAIRCGNSVIRVPKAKLIALEQSGVAGCPPEADDPTRVACGCPHEYYLHNDDPPTWQPPADWRCDYAMPENELQARRRYGSLHWDTWDGEYYRELALELEMCAILREPISVKQWMRAPKVGPLTGRHSNAEVIQFPGPRLKWMDRMSAPVPDDEVHRLREELDDLAKEHADGLLTAKQLKIGKKRISRKLASVSDDDLPAEWLDDDTPIVTTRHHRETLPDGFRIISDISEDRLNECE